MLKELALNAQVVFYVHVSDFISQISSVLHDRTVTIQFLWNLL